MSFDGTLGNVQIASDFLFVTALEQQVDNLPVARVDLFEFLFHKNFT